MNESGYRVDEVVEVLLDIRNGQPTALLAVWWDFPPGRSCPENRGPRRTPGRCQKPRGGRRAIWQTRRILRWNKTAR